MRFICRGLALWLALSVTLFMAAQTPRYRPRTNSENLQLQVEQLFALANRDRAQAGAGNLRWDPALSAAALEHCRRMSAEGPIAHRYAGELDLAARTAQAGAHFSLIEENVAVGPSAPVIHDEWMHSPGHRTNLLNPEVDRVGVAVVAGNGAYYAVADYARGVQPLTVAQVEFRISALVRTSGVSVLSDTAQARAACAVEHGFGGSAGRLHPRFVMRWQGADLTRLPQSLEDRLASGHYRSAAVGNCAPQGEEGSFTAFRIAVLLYE